MRKRKEAGKGGQAGGVTPVCHLLLLWVYSGSLGYVSYEGHKTVQDPHVEGQACPLKQFS